MALPNGTFHDTMLQLGKGMARRITSVAAAYTALLDDDVIIVGTAAAPFTITLPTAASCYDSATRTGKVFIFKNPDTDDVTIDAAGDETIDGATTFVLDAQYETVTLISDGTSWHAI
jgi:hypothetical protein